MWPKGSRKVLPIPGVERAFPVPTLLVERIGIQALTKRLAEQFDLSWEFIDLPNPV